MYERYMLETKSFQNTYDRGTVTGFQLGVRITHYHGIPLSLIEDFEAVVDGEVFKAPDMTFTVKNQTFTIGECRQRVDVRWDFGEVAYLRIKKPGGLKQGLHQVKFVQTLFAYGWPTVNTFETELMLQSGIKRGVTLYSYQQEYYVGKMDLEAMVKAVADMDCDGVEILTEAIVPDFPNPSDMYIYRWFELMDKYRTKPVCYDSSFDSRNYYSRANGKEEGIEKLKADIRLAKRMGFSIMRAQGPHELLFACLPYAEEMDMVLGSEVHAPNALESEWVSNIVEHVDKTKTRHLALIPDMGIFAYRPLRIACERSLRMGANPELVRYVIDSYIARADAEAVKEEVKKRGGNEHDLWCATEAFYSIYCDPAKLEQLAPYICHIHGKFYEMTDFGYEYSLDYKTAIDALKKGNWEGYISSEYEGQRHFHDLRTFEVDSVAEVRKHHQMLKNYIEG